MPIGAFLEVRNFDAETARVMGVTKWCTQFLREIGAKLPTKSLPTRMIEFAKAGETNPARICEQVLVYFRGTRF
jgi:hypothetical protein